MSDTIAAVATGGGVSAIGIVRISGDSALTVADNVFRVACGIRLKDAECKRMYYGAFVDGFNERCQVNVSLARQWSRPPDSPVDLCLCVISRAPNSYTGEDTVEFHCHGSPVVLSEVLQTLFEHGVRQALPGEFTKRAFLNGRMDLTQAEAVIDIIEAETLGAVRNAVGQLQGIIGMKLDSLYNQLLDIMAHFHAVIDYPDEDIDEFSLQNYLTKLQNIYEELEQMSQTHKRGKILKDGIPTAIIGRPNTGKSSLLNALLGYERAIVTEVAGTTRDTVEEKVLMGNVLLRLIDTAGLRHTNDAIEKLGVERAFAALSGAGLVLLVFDGSQPLMREDYDALHSIPPDTPKIAVVNKSDLPAVISDVELNKLEIKNCRISALSGEGLNSLDDEIGQMFPVFGQPYGLNTHDKNTPLSTPSSPGDLITNTRHAEAISRASTRVKAAIESLTDSVTPDAVLTDIESALASVGEVTGKTIREDIVLRIFERFCVGK